jgi:hypothetical protein
MYELETLNNRKERIQQKSNYENFKTLRRNIALFEGKEMMISEEAYPLGRFRESHSW